MLIVVLGLIAVGFSAAYGREMDEMGGMDESESEGRFIRTAIMGSDDRCRLSYGSQATAIEKAFYGVGAFYPPSSNTSAPTDNHYNKGTGHLVESRDLVVTAAHNFRKRGTSDYGDWKKYKFFVKVWVPEEKRRILDRPYEFRAFGIKRICFGVKNANIGDYRDFALLQLAERVSEVVDGIPVDPQHWIEPLAFDGRARESFPNVAMTVGFHRDKKWVAQKNCKPFSLFDQTPDISPSFLSSERRRGLLITNGDFMKRSSGSSIALLDEKGKPHLAAILGGDFADAPKVNFDGRDQFNYAIDAKEFYSEFVGFRKSLDASEDELCKGSQGKPLRSRM
ncbi:MAG: hypothetical protein IPK68_19440 [Bdellovibrionales bacterium]|nr:hypothetical protein [Bdellovibrionales bacterium]